MKNGEGRSGGLKKGVILDLFDYNVLFSTHGLATTVINEALPSEVIPFVHPYLRRRPGPLIPVINRVVLILMLHVCTATLEIVRKGGPTRGGM